MGCVDSLSIVTFFAIAKRMIGDGKQVAMEVVNALACTGGTAIAEGLRKGSEILKQRRFKNPSHMSKESSVVAMHRLCTLLLLLPRLFLLLPQFPLLLLQFASLSSLCLELIEEGNSSQTTADMKVVCYCSCFATQIGFFPPS